uniref:(northern house mosquito) hypothetical protein n=1 Tax=Culex pipiens TaxID=7175 RepID=A0A8D8E2P4_CULPI
MAELDAGLRRGLNGFRFPPRSAKLPGGPAPPAESPICAGFGVGMNGLMLRLFPTRSDTGLRLTGRRWLFSDAMMSLMLGEKLLRGSLRRPPAMAYWLLAILIWPGRLPSIPGGCW